MIFTKIQAFVSKISASTLKTLTINFTKFTNPKGKNTLSKSFDSPELMIHILYRILGFTTNRTFLE